MRQKNEYHEALNASERRVNSLGAEIDELRLSLSQADRAHKLLENDLHDAANHISQISANNDNLMAVKRKLESDVSMLGSELDDAHGEVKRLEESVRKAVAETMRASEDLKQEQEHAMAVDKHKKMLDQQIKDLQDSLDQAEANALKSGKKIVQKLEQRVSCFYFKEFLLFLSFSEPGESIKNSYFYRKFLI